MNDQRARSSNAAPSTRSRGALWVPVAGLLAGGAALAMSAWTARSHVAFGPSGPEAAPATNAEFEAGREVIELPVTIPELMVLSVSPHGVTQGSFGSRSGCSVLASLTDANFSGGTYKVQAGFAQTEMFASTYILTAGDFPIKIDLAEAIFATKGATQSTTTQWSVLFYSGEPNGGVLVDSFSSNDIDLPHIHLPPGDSGVNVQFSIDTSQGDPPVIINDNGTHKFTVAWRIDHHNQQTQNPCFVAPPSCCNAFPVVDVSGLAFPQQNWLFGVNCGQFGCPANGGWAKFSSLGSGCRPTGDVVQRVTWSSVSCNPGVGPCCLPNGTCQVMTTSDCQSAGGTYQGDGTSCTGITCPTPKGACCYSNGFCISNMSQSDCAGSGGNWLGSGTACNGNQCPTGACCKPDGSCVNGVTSAQCAAMSGTFKGVGSNCSGANCPQPSGACCFSNGFCVVLQQIDCTGAGGTWAGPLTTCADSNGDGHADICPCLSDYDTNGFVNGDDFDAFTVDFDAGNQAADVDHNGFVNGDDFDTFTAHFDAGC